jgi:hypothetical protein
MYVLAWQNRTEQCVMDFYACIHIFVYVNIYASMLGLCASWEQPVPLPVSISLSLS